MALDWHDWERQKVERNRKNERERLRTKRKNSLYLSTEQNKNARRMARLREDFKRDGLCSCGRTRTGDYLKCATCRDAARQYRGTK